VIVIDASALLEMLLGLPESEAVQTRVFRTGETLHAPCLIDVEVAQALRRHAAAGALSEQRGREALVDLADFALRRYAHDFLLMRVWDLRNNLSAYDAAYVALAEALDAPLLTRDRGLATAAKRHARVELV
jgi:predicted nucleic acid-binding protein